MTKSIIGFVIGLIGGFFGGLVGLGGGTVMIPLMTLLMKLSQHKAHGTSLVAVIFIGLVGMLTYFLYDTVDWRVSVILATSAVLTARLGALYAHSLSEKKLKSGFGIYLVFVSILLVAKGHFPWVTHILTPWILFLIFVAVGAATGFISGMMGIGGGTIMIPSMVLLGGMSQHVAQGTSFLAMVPMSIAGALTHYRLGNVETRIALGLIIGAIFGVYLGGTTANHLPELYLKFVFASVLTGVGIRYIRA